MIAVVLSINVNAQIPGSLDTTFNSRDKGFGFGDGASSSVFTAAIQNDRKIIIGGGFIFYNGTKVNHIARINVNGTIDTTFNSGTGANYSIKTIVLQSDGKIVIGGSFTAYNGIIRNGIARLNVNGSIDTTFNIGSGADSTLRTIAIQKDGKVIIGGDFIFYNGIKVNHIARLNSDGTIDTTFKTGTGTNNIINTCVIQNDEKIIIGGNFNTYNGIVKGAIVRLNSDGVLDTTFNVGTGALDYNNNFAKIFSCALQTNGKIIIGGDFYKYNGTTQNYLARINSDGSLDGTFNVGNAFSHYVIISAFAIQNDGKIIIGGDFSSYNGVSMRGITRLNTNGTLDKTFKIWTWTKIYCNVRTCVIQNDGKIIIGGDFSSTPREYITQLNADGSLDENFNRGTGANNSIHTTAIQSNGKIIIGGYFTSYNGTPVINIARINTDGSLDSTFNVGTIIDRYDITTFSIQGDGKIIIGGDFTIGASSRKNVARLNMNGSVDTTFNVGTGAGNKINTSAIQSDGKVIIAGLFYTYNGTSINRIARLNTDGSLDKTFNNGQGPNGGITKCVIQNNGKIIIVGSFTTYDGINRNHIARLNIDGSLDSTFKVGSGTNDEIFSAEIQNDEKIILAGLFTSYNGVSRSNIVRLNTDGSIDSTFKTGAGLQGSFTAVEAIAIQNDGKIIIGGAFTMYDGTDRSNIARLNVDGSIDTTFNIGTGVESGQTDIETIALQDDGKIIIGGHFTSYNGRGRNRIARINGCSIVSPCVSNNSGINDIDNNEQLLIYPNPNNGLFTIQTEHEGTYSIVDELGQTIQILKLNATNNYSMNIENLNNGIYFIVGFNNNEMRAQKVVVAK